MSNPTTRVNYFDHQFLKEDDFKDEQAYHLEMRRRHNQRLHTSGIARGDTEDSESLEVEKIDSKKVKVYPGIAIDPQGREMLQFDPVEIDLAGYQPKALINITIAYNEEKTNPQPSEGSPIGYTRITEKPVIKAINTPPPDDAVRLAYFQLDDSGNVPGANGQKLNGGVRQLISPTLPDGSVSIEKLKKILLKKEDIGVKVPGSSEHTVLVFQTDQNSPYSAFLLVYAYSPTPGAIFSWNEKYITEGTGSNFTMKQIVVFSNRQNTPIDLYYTIYALL